MSTQYLDKTGLEALVTNIKAEDTKIKNLIGTVPAKVGETDTATVVAYVNAKADAAQAEADGRISAIETSLGENGTTAAAIKNNTDAITTLNGDDTTAGSVAKAVADEATARNTAISTAIGTLTVAEGADSTVANAIAKAAADASSALTNKLEGLDADIKSADNADVTAGKGTNVNVEVVETDGKITAVKVTETDIASAATVATLVGSDSGKSARTIANEELAAQLIPSTAKESLNSLTEIAAWIQQHPDDAAAMNTQIQANAAAIGTEAVAAVTHEATQEDVDAGKASTIGETVVDTAAVEATGLQKKVAELETVTAGIESIPESDINTLFA